MCFCDTNCRLYHEKPCPGRGRFTPIVRARLLGEPFKVITVDKSAVDYYRKLSELTAQIHKIGVLYNQAVRAIHSYHSDQVARVLLERLERYSARIVLLLEEAVRLTIDFRSR